MTDEQFPLVDHIAIAARAAFMGMPPALSELEWASFEAILAEPVNRWVLSHMRAAEEVMTWRRVAHAVLACVAPKLDSAPALAAGTSNKASEGGSSDAASE